MHEPLSRAIAAQRDRQSMLLRLQPRALKRMRFAGSFELKADVFLFDETNRGCQGEAASDKDGFAISDPEGLAACEPIEEVLCQVNEGDFGVAGTGVA